MVGPVKNEQQDWVQAVELLSRWEGGLRHADDLLEVSDPGRLRWLVMEVFRQWLPIEAALSSRLKRPPRPKVRQLLRLALAECLSREEASRPQIVHNAGEVAKVLKLSKAERGFLNAVLRRCLREGFSGVADPGATHPRWMVDRWIGCFGEDATAKLLEWNQSKGEVHVQADGCPAYAETTDWEGYYRVKPSRFHEALPDLKRGVVYAQDPFARVPVGLLAPQAGEHILDLCAAPGGKTRLLARAMEGKGTLTAVDRPGRRLERLRGNVSLIPAGLVTIVGKPLQDLTLDDLDGPADGILLDVPCSNTGVIRKRPDVKLRLNEEDIQKQTDLQLELLRLASGWVRPGGRLVYTTCSLETEENEGVVHGFLDTVDGWILEKSVLSRPWECQHDGGGAFLLTKKKCQ
jgi:16S rRNA (cytosine967-C5)-methyltransferase